MPTYDIKQATADEITQMMWIPRIRDTPSKQAQEDWWRATNFYPPGYGPDGGNGESGEIPDAVPGFDKVIKGAWDWAAGKLKLDTASLGGIGCNGILICSFTPTAPADGVAAMASVAGYPSPNMGNVLVLCISRQPGVLYEPSPAFSDGQHPTLNYCVGTPQNSWTLELEPGVTYYLNVAGRGSVTDANPAGVATCIEDTMYFKPDGSACDFRLEANVPTGH